MRLCWATLLLCWCATAGAQVTYTVTTDADAFLATGAAGNPDGADLTGNNYGGAGTLVVESTNSVKGEFQSVIRFNVAGAVALFNSDYGTNGWTVGAISLTLASNYGTGGVQPNNPIFGVISGGKFVIEWLADDDWAEGTGNPNLPTTDGVTYDSLPTLLAGGRVNLGTNTYTPPGNNIQVTYPLSLESNLVSNIDDGGEVSLRFYAADDQINYLFSSHEYGRGNQPLINVTAAPFFTITAGYFTNGVFHLTGAGAFNWQYQVQASTNLVTGWQTLGTVTTDGNGVMHYDDVTATNKAWCFYRLAQ
jgi:hypothetical protein